MATITETIRLEGSDEVKSALSDIGQAGDEAFQALGDAAQTVAEAFRPLTGLSIDFSKVFAGIGSAVDDVSSAVTHIKELFESAGGGAKEFGAATAEVSGNAAQFGTAVEASGQAVEAAGAGVGGLVGQLNPLAEGLGIAAAGASGTGLAIKGIGFASAGTAAGSFIARLGPVSEGLLSAGARAGEFGLIIEAAVIATHAAQAAFGALGDKVAQLKNEFVGAISGVAPFGATMADAGSKAQQLGPSLDSGGEGMSRVSGAAEFASRALSNVKGAFISFSEGAAIIVAAGASVTAALAVMGESASKGAAKIGDAADAAHLDVKSWQELAYAAQQVGASSKDLTKFFTKFDEDQRQFALQSKASADEFKKQQHEIAIAAEERDAAIARTGRAPTSGIREESIKEQEQLDKLSRDHAESIQKLSEKFPLLSGGAATGSEALLAFADSVKAVNDPTQQATLAVARLGPELGRNMLPFLQAGSAGIAEYIADFQKLHIALTAEQVEIARDEQIAVGNLKQVINQSRIATGLLFAPVITAGADWLTEKLVHWNDAVSAFTSGALTKAREIIKDFITVLSGGGAVTNDWVAPFVSAIESLGAALNGIVTPAIDAFKNAFGSISGSVILSTAAILALSSLFGPFGTLIGAAGAAFLLFGGNVSSAGDIVKGVTGIVKDFSAAISGRDAEVSNSWILTFVHAVEDVGTVVKAVFDDILLPAFRAASKVADGFAAAINAALGTHFTGAGIVISAIIFELVGGFRTLKNVVDDLKGAFDTFAPSKGAVFEIGAAAAVASVGFGLLRGAIELGGAALSELKKAADGIKSLFSNLFGVVSAEAAEVDPGSVKKAVADTAAKSKIAAASVKTDWALVGDAALAALKFAVDPWGLWVNSSKKAVTSIKDDLASLKPQGAFDGALDSAKSGWLGLFQTLDGVLNKTKEAGEKTAGAITATVEVWRGGVKEIHQVFKEGAAEVGDEQEQIPRAASKAKAATIEIYRGGVKDIISVFKESDISASLPSVFGSLDGVRKAFKESALGSKGGEAAAALKEIPPAAADTSAAIKAIPAPPLAVVKGAHDIKGALSDIPGALSDLKAAIVAPFQELKSRISDALPVERIQSQAQKAVDAIRITLAEAGPEAAKAIQGVESAIKDSIASADPAIRSAGQHLLDTFNSALRVPDATPQSVFRAIVEAIKAGLDAGRPGIEGAAKGVITAIDGPLAAAQGVAHNAGVDIARALQAGATAGVPGAAQSANALVEAFHRALAVAPTAVSKAAEQFAKAYGDAIAKGAPGASASARELISGAIKEFEKIGGQAHASFQPIADAPKKALEEAIGPAQAQAKRLSDAVSSALSKAGAGGGVSTSPSAALTASFPAVSAAAKRTADAIVAAFADAKEKISASFSGLSSALIAPFQAAGNGIKAIWGSVAAFVRAGVASLETSIASITGNVGAMIDTIISKLQAAVAEAQKLAAATASASSPQQSSPSGGSGGSGGFAWGGLVRGAGTATSDSIPARLSHGEYVHSAAAVSHYGVNFMHAVNTLKFAFGGLVGSALAPAFAFGGLARMPAFSGGGPVSGGRELHLTLGDGGPTFKLSGAPSVIGALERHAVLSQMSSTTKRAPSRVR